MIPENLSPANNSKPHRGRPRKFTYGGTVNISASIERRQQDWLQQIANSSANESVSGIIRDALDLWYRVHVEGQSVSSADQKHYFLGDVATLAQKWIEDGWAEPSAPATLHTEDGDGYQFYDWQ